MQQRIAVIDNGIGQILRLNYLNGIQKKESRGEVLEQLSAWIVSIDEARRTFE
jgi:hypothetical protein